MGFDRTRRKDNSGALWKKKGIKPIPDKKEKRKQGEKERKKKTMGGKKLGGFCNLRGQIQGKKGGGAEQKRPPVSKGKKKKSGTVGGKYQTPQNELILMQHSKPNHGGLKGRENILTYGGPSERKGKKKGGKKKRIDCNELGAEGNQQVKKKKPEKHRRVTRKGEKKRLWQALLGRTRKNRGAITLDRSKKKTGGKPIEGDLESPKKDLRAQEIGRVSLNEGRKGRGHRSNAIK